MTLKCVFTSITLNSHQEVPLSPTGVTCIVGANNSGKSQLLKDLVETSRDGASGNFAYGGPSKPRIIVQESGLTFEGVDDDSIANWLRLNTVAVESGSPSNVALPPTSMSTQREAIESLLRNAAMGHGLQYATDAVIRRVPAGGLTSYAQGELRTDWSPDSLSNWLLRILMENGQLARQFSDIINDLFGVPCFIDRVSFPPRLRAGKLAVKTPPLDDISQEYADAVSACRTLDEQGDGMRSFAGLALLVLALSPSVLLLDEPETFLHPAQARAVGRWLSREATERGMQVIVATHDRDFLLGLLDTPDPAVEIMRLRRSDGGAHIKRLSAEELDGYRSRPSLRYSNILQGLFHERVVICEGEADCRFYAAVTDEIAASRNARHIADNTLFVPSSGDGGVAKLAELLRELEVSVSTIIDFDTIERVHVIKAILVALGHAWDEELESAWAKVDGHARGASGFWQRMKNAGIHGAPAGGATKAIADFVALLAQRGVNLVPVGELEDFHREAGKGAHWINAALDADAHKTPVACSLIETAVPELGADARAAPAPSTTSV